MSSTTFYMQTRGERERSFSLIQTPTAGLTPYQLGVRMPRNESSGAKTSDAQMMLESPVSRAFGLGKFAIVPIDKPLDSKLSRQETICEEAQIRSCALPSDEQVPLSTTAAKPNLKDAMALEQQALLQQYKAIWNTFSAANDLAQKVISCSSESPTYQDPNCGLYSTSHQDFQQSQKHDEQDDAGQTRTPLFLQSELMQPEFLNQVLKKRASLATMTLRQDRIDDVFQTASTHSSVGDQDLSSFAEAFTDSFNRNLFREEKVKTPEFKPGKMTPPSFQSNAFDALACDNTLMRNAYGCSLTSRAKAYSLQVPLTSNVQRGGNSQSDHATSSSVGSSPAFGPSKPTCLRSLLMEPDMEDLTAIIPRTLDFVDDLDCSFEEDDHALNRACLSFQPTAIGKSQSLFLPSSQ